jgi:hypothetical protein
MTRHDKERANTNAITRKPNKMQYLIVNNYKFEKVNELNT